MEILDIGLKIRLKPLEPNLFLIFYLTKIKIEVKIKVTKAGQ